MSPFSIEDQSLGGRRGRIETPHGTVETPTLFPVVNFIAGTTHESGGMWKYTREALLNHGDVDGVMMQAMSFLEFNLSPENLNNFWRSKPLHDHFEYLDRPLFIDSGGFTLMNAETFGLAPEEGGEENEWGIYTDPESILDLQLDFGASLIATLDYPIPPNLNDREKADRMERSVESAVECLELLEEREEDPAVYVAIHGHDYEAINWYVSQFLDRAQGYLDVVEGFAVGSLVPLRSQRKVGMLVDIVQGAKDAIPESRVDDLGLHVFGVSGKMVPLLTLLGVDSFDSTTYQRTAQYKNFIHPQTWEDVEARELPEDWACDCVACENMDLATLNRVLYADTSYTKVDGEYWKSEFYAKIALHNFEVHHREIEALRTAISEDRLLEHVATFAEDHPQVAEGVKHAQLRDGQLRRQIDEAGYSHLQAGPAHRTFQATLSAFRKERLPSATSERTISLRHGPDDFDVMRRDYSPPTARILLILPCSQQKPYGESRTQQAVLSELGPLAEETHKVTLSGLYGPVPEQYEEERPVLEYEYVLTMEDREQIELVASRLQRFLEVYGDEFDTIVGYTTNAAYRSAMETAFERYGRGHIYPVDPESLQLTEHFRRDNIEELLSQLQSRVGRGDQQSTLVLDS